MKALFLAAAALAALVLASCATTLPVTVQHPAQMDVGAVGSVAVLPFGYPAEADTAGLAPLDAGLYRLWHESRAERAERELAAYAESVFVAALLDAKRYEVLKADQLRGLLRPEGGAAPAADAYVVGRLSEFSKQVEDRSYFDADNKFVPSFRLSLKVAVAYQLVRADSGRIVGARDLRDGDLLEGKNRWDLERRADQAAKAILDRFQADIRRQLAPYQTTEYLVFADDEAKDKRMEAAKKLARDGFVDKAMRAYAAVFADTRNKAAGYNAALCREALGDRPGALADMRALADEFADARALRQAQRMQRVIDEEKAAAAQAKP